MIDWFRGQIDILHQPIPTGSVMSVEPDGSLAWESVKKLEVRSSHQTSVRIRSTGGDGTGLATSLQIDGNLVKFLQGHNVFGSTDLNALLSETMKKILSITPIIENDFSLKTMFSKIQRGDYLVNMFDLNRMFDLDNDESVESTLHALEMRARSRSGRATRDKGTIYLAKNSRRWAVKFYNKHREMNARGHKLPPSFLESGLNEFSIGKLRCEFRFHSLELKNMGVTHGYHITQKFLNDLFINYLGRIEMNTNAILHDTALLNIPRPIQSSYYLWRSGVSLKDMLAKNTFYRHRRLLLEHDIDITCPPTEIGAKNNVIPIFKILEAKPVSIPEWAYTSGLVAC
jgi:II/X family phage/plasmid replication protein